MTIIAVGWTKQQRSVFAPETERVQRGEDSRQGEEMSTHTNFTSLSAQPPSQELRGSTSQPSQPAPQKKTMATGRRIKGQGTAALKQKYITPADVHIPVAAKISTLSHYAIPINQIAAQLAAQASRIVNGPDGNRKTEIDGFYLLEVGGLSFPEDLQQINLTDRKLSTVVDEDLTYFTELLYVDASENFLPLYPFGALPQLRELRLACNHIEQIGELYGFEKLLYLDLSYNKIAARSVADLGRLPLLKELDLSGNQLSSLPSDLSAFSMLEKLVLDYNKFDDNSLFLAMASIPNLRVLDVAHNYFSVLPNDAMEFDGFKFLEELDLAFNYFGNEDAVRLVLKMPRLVRLILYGNPLLGPTGEDPLFAYIEDLVEDAVQVRDQAQTSIPDIDFITEIPRRRVIKKGQPLGRLALYRDFSIVQVDDPRQAQELSARQWKAKGIQTLFGETVAQRRGGASTMHAAVSGPASSAPLLPDLTFITNSIAATNLAAQHLSSAPGSTPGTTTAAAAAAAASGLFTAGDGQVKPAQVKASAGGLDVDRIADDVMQKVALEMGLLGSDELRVFEQLTRLAPTVLEREARQQAADEQRGRVDRQRWEGEHRRAQHTGNDDDDDDGEVSSVHTRTQEDDWSLGGSTLASDPDLHARTGGSPAAPLDDDDDDGEAREDRVPSSLFASNLHDGVAPLPAQPVALRTAMKALQHALRQPLTDYRDVPASRCLGGVQAHAKHTSSSRARQLPRIPLSASSCPAGHGDGDGDEAEARGDRRSQRWKRRGLAEPPVYQRMRQETRDRTLLQIDHVLTQLNAHTEKMTDDRGAGAGAGAGAGTPAAGVGHLRQNMESMRTFAKPKSGVAKLLGMVSSIVDEFTS